jgi:hypothetical protein
MKLELRNVAIFLAIWGIVAIFAFAGYSILYKGGKSHNYNTHYLHE